MLISSVHCSGESDTNCPVTSVHCSPQSASDFPEIDFSTKFTFFDAGDFSSDFEMLAMGTNKGCYFYIFVLFLIIFLADKELQILAPASSSQTGLVTPIPMECK